MEAEQRPSQQGADRSRQHAQGGPGVQTLDPQSYRERVSIQNFLAIKSSARMLYYYSQRFCCAVNFIEKSFKLKLISHKIVHPANSKGAPLQEPCHALDAKRFRWLPLSGTHLPSQTLSLLLVVSPSLSPSFSLALSLSRLALSLAGSLPFSLSLSLSRSHTHTQSLSPSLSHSLSHTHTRPVPARARNPRCLQRSAIRNHRTPN